MHKRTCLLSHRLQKWSHMVEPWSPAWQLGKVHSRRRLWWNVSCDVWKLTSIEAITSFRLTGLAFRACMLARMVVDHVPPGASPSLYTVWSPDDRSVWLCSSASYGDANQRELVILRYILSCTPHKVAWITSFSTFISANWPRSSCLFSRVRSSL